MKKNFVCFVVLCVLLFGVTACSKSNVKPGDSASINNTTTSPLEVWRGKIVRVETNERWAKILVEDPGDNPDHQFMLNVIRQSYNKAYDDFKGLNLLVGKELLFIRFDTFSERRSSTFIQGACSVGVFVTFWNEGDVVTRLIKIMNPPKK